MIPREDRAKWDPHVSRHANGWEHHKSFARPSLRTRRQVPDENFRGSENLVTIPLHRDGLIEMKDNAQFDEIFPVSLCEIVSDPPPLLAVDLTEPFGSPIVTPGARIIQEFKIKDQVPWIALTIYIAVD